MPIPGTRDLDRLAANVAAGDIRLAPADLQRLEGALSHAAWAGDRDSFAVPVSTRTPS